MAALAGEQGRYRLHVQHRLGAEAAADFQRDGLDVGYGDAQEPGGVVADGELALAAGPDGQLAVCAPLGGAGVGFDVALVHRNGLGFLLDDDVGLLEAFLHVAEAELELVGDVAARAVFALVQQPAGAQRRVGQAGQPLVDGGGAGLHGVVGVENGGENFVVHLDERQRLLGHVGVDGGHGGDGVALVQRLAPGQHVHAQEAQVLDGALGEVGETPGSFRPVGGGHDCADAGIRLGLAGVDGLDDGVGVRAAQNLAVEQTGQALVGAVPRPSGDFFRAVGANWPFADHVKFFIGKYDIRLVIQHLRLLTVTV